MTTRLVRYLAQCGVASRRGAADVVRSGVVSVNGKVTDDVSLGIAPTDRVTVRGKKVQPPEATTVLILNKPRGVVCSVRDPHNPRTVLDYVPPELKRFVKPVGRLDKDTTGLILLTDDGDLAYCLTHPKHKVEKLYRAVVEGRVAPDTVKELSAGVLLDDGPTAPARVRVVGRTERQSTLDLTIHEGRNRQVRRMLHAVGHPVVKLERTSVGSLRLGKLRQGQTRVLDATELERLRSLVGLSDKPR